MRVLAAAAAAVAWVAAGCAGHVRGAVDPTQVLSVREDAIRTHHGAVLGVAASLPDDPCAAADQASDVAMDAPPMQQAAFREFAVAAAWFCDAGVRGAEAASDEFGNPVVRRPEAGVLGSDGALFVWDPPEGQPLAQLHAVEGDRPVCNGGGDDDADLVVYPMIDGAITLVVEPAIELLAVGNDGRELCSDADVGVLTLSSAGAPWSLYAGTTGAALDAQLSAAHTARGPGSFVWAPGQTESFPVQVGPYTAPASGISGSCTGYIAAAPNLRFSTFQSGYGYVEVAAERDTVLVVRGPTGQVSCNDDTVGLNPALDLYLDPGEYEVWVGSYSPSVETEATITFY